MEKFSSEWLALREQEDLLARNSTILECVIEHLKGEKRLNILDIGCGTGATMRALLPKFEQPQHWTLLDVDQELLARAQCLNEPLVSDPNYTLETKNVNLTAGFEFLNSEYSLVTATALLDLVSEAWIKEFAKALKHNNLSFYCSITPNNRIETDPKDNLDEKVISTFNTHRYSDKGFGMSLGGNAADFTIAQLQSLGYNVRSSSERWGNRHQNKSFRKIFNTKLVEGISQAVNNTKLLDVSELKQWTDSRLSAIQNEGCEIWFEVIDFLAIPN